MAPQSESATTHRSSTSSHHTTQHSSSTSHHTSSHTSSKTTSSKRSTKTTHTSSASRFPQQSRSVPASAPVPISSTPSSLPAASSLPAFSSVAPVSSGAATHSSFPVSSQPARQSSYAARSSYPGSRPASSFPAANGPSHTPVSGASHNHGHGSGLSSGDIAAAVVVPIVLLIATVSLAFCFFRRRRQRRSRLSSRPASSDQALPPSADREMSTIIPTDADLKMAEAAVTPDDKPVAVPVVTTSHNNAYLSGIDTEGSSPTSSGRGYDDSIGQRRGHSTLVEPPPPYQGRARSSTTATTTTKGSSSLHTSADYSLSNHSAETYAPGAIGANQPWSYDIGPLAMPDFGTRFDPLTTNPDYSHTNANTNSNFRSPVSPLEAEHAFAHNYDNDATLWAPPHAPALQNHSQTALSRTQSNRSITSTLYSDSASLHDAHEAAPVRCSIIGRAGGEGHMRSTSDPFTDPPSVAT